MENTELYLTFIYFSMHTRLYKMLYMHCFTFFSFIDDYVINGGKMWTTNGDQADWMCLLANTGGNNPHLNKSLICVPMNTPGITKSPTLSKLGMRSSDTVQVFFDNVKVPQKYRIGEEGKGFIYQMNQFQDERLVAGVQGNNR